MAGDGTSEARADRDVASDLRGALIAPKPVHRAAITTPREAGALLRSIEAFKDSANVHAALRLLPHVIVRPGELRFAEWADIDLDKAVWTIPAHKTKMRRAHSIPLSRQSLAILCSIERDADYNGFLLPSRTSVDRPRPETHSVNWTGGQSDLTTGRRSSFVNVRTRPTLTGSLSVRCKRSRSICNRL